MSLDPSLVKEASGQRMHDPGFLFCDGYCLKQTNVKVLFNDGRWYRGDSVTDEGPTLDYRALELCAGPFPS